MEAGITPAKESVTDQVGLKLHELGSLILNTCNFSAHKLSKQETSIINSLLSTITTQANTYANSHTHYQRNVLTHPCSLRHVTYTNLLHIHVNLWNALKYPHSTYLRTCILKFLVIVQEFVESTIQCHNYTNSSQTSFSHPQKTSKPSYSNQITSPQSLSIDPYLLALRQNYYYPLNIDNMSEEMEEDTNTTMIPTNPAQPSSPKRTPSKCITVEDSIETITDIISELEEDDPPVQTQPTQQEDTAVQQAIQLQASSYSHRFSIYKRNGLPVSNLKTSSQIALFQSFCKCLKSIDTQLQMLPIRNDHNIHPLSTTDQITNIDEIGITNYFKAYKRTKRTLSGDFHIGTKLSFDEIKDHKNLTTWFHLHGYNVTISGCQSSDMVRIGFLSRVRGFTYRDDMHAFITNSEPWKQNKFHFRLYFDIFSSGAKGQNSYVLMIDVDRPNIETATTYFQQNFDGDKQTSPNKIAYLFFPLYRKTYTTDERLSIIRDNEHHTEHDSVVGVFGLNNLNTVVQMVQGINITIRHLLLAIPCQGTSNGKLFHQIERQANNEWQLCCFHTMDTTKVSLKLANLESLIKRYIRAEDHKFLFTDLSKPLKFSGQAAPIKKGKPKIPVLEVTDATMKYTSQAFTKLFNPTPKRSVTPNNMNEHTLSPITNNIAHAVSPHQHKSPSHQNSVEPVQDSELRAKVTTFENEFKNQNSRLTRLEDICSQLATSTQNLSTQLITFNQTVTDKLGAMANSIDLLHQSPSRHVTKYQKATHNDDYDNINQS